MGHGEHSVPESAAGILYQLERALYWLATCARDGIVGVETDDDVAVHDPSGGNVSEQDKFSLQVTGHPFQDRGKGLWNTLGIWLKAARDGTAGQRSAELHLVTNRPVPANCLVRQIAKPAKTDLELKVCIERLRTIGSDPPESLAAIIEAVCAFTDEEIKQVLTRVLLFDAAHGTEGPALRKETTSRLHLPPDVNDDMVAQSLLGWLHDTLRATWRAKSPGWIQREAFDRQLDAVMRHQRADRKRERAERLVSVSEEDRAAARGLPFVERLIEIELDDDDILRAIDSYVRFSTECFRLNGQGDIVRSDWENFYDHLTERWEGIRRRRSRNRSAERDEELGQSIFRDTTDNDYLAPLAGRATEHFYFTRGSYHRLADTDRVWWHPQYRPTNPSVRSGIP